MRIAFLASHRGSNMQAVIDACGEGRLDATPAVLVCNNRNAEAIRRAGKHGIPAYVLNAARHADPADLDRAILTALEKHGSELILLAGFMKKIGPRVLSAYRGRILNVHPALLPKYGGKGMFGAHVHQAVLAAGEKVTGVTVHLADDEYDQGKILAQAEVPVLAGDSIETLAARVLEKEHELLVSTLRRIVSGDINLRA